MVWAVDKVNRQLGRALGAMAGLVMVAAVFHLEAGTSRIICSLFAGVLLLRAAWPRRLVHPASPASIRDLIDLEKRIIAVREDVERRDDAVGDRLDGIAELVTEIRDQVR